MFTVPTVSYSWMCSEDTVLNSIAVENIWTTLFIFSPEFKLLTTLSLKEAWGKVIFAHILLISAFKENFIIYIYQMYLF